MKPATIQRIHSVMSSALDLAVRYEWADRNMARNASPPHPRKREPDPPTPEQAARLLNLVWAEDEEFGLYLWTAFTTGARRGEVSALRENRFDFRRQQVRVSANYIVKQGNRIEKPPKAGEGRLLSLDLLTCELFRERFRRRRAEAQALAVQVPDDAFAFSPDPDGRTPWNPDTMTHRYRRYARRASISSSLKELRHYSATQLLSNGVDLNTVAGRLGHAEGSTTLRFYAQFTRPADEQAAGIIPTSLDGLRRKERLRELYLQSPAADLEDLAASLGPAAGLDHQTALAWLAELTASGQSPSEAARSGLSLPRVTARPSRGTRYPPRCASHAVGMAFRAAQEDRYERELVMNTTSARCQAKTADMRLWGIRLAGQRGSV
jgi:integrase